MKQGKYIHPKKPMIFNVKNRASFGGIRGSRDYGLLWSIYIASCPTNRATMATKYVTAVCLTVLEYMEQHELRSGIGIKEHSIYIRGLILIIIITVF